MLPDRPFFDRLADAAKAETLPRFRTGIGVVNKQDGGFDPVTEGDRAAEAAIRALIEEAYPDHGILGEEYGTMGGDRDYVWVIDPIDGTRLHFRPAGLGDADRSLSQGPCRHGSDGPALYRRALFCG